MSTDYEDREREFLTYLKADTGRDLAGWMSAIDEAKLAHRNEIIDWLRRQGFIFAWASWMERIHHNGGRPIYLDEAPASLAAPPRSAPGSRQSATVPPPDPATAMAPGSRTGAPPGRDAAFQPPAPKPPASEPPPRQPLAPQPPAARARPVLVYSAPAPQEPPELVAPVASAAQPASPPPAASSQSEPQQKPLPAPAPPAIQAPVQATVLSPEVSGLIAKAKAYTPLAAFILRSIAEALPGTAFHVSGNYVACNHPGTFAILVPGPKHIKLGLALASAPFGRDVVAARFPNLSPAPPKSVTYMAVLTDARQVDAGLLDLLRSADAAANG